MIRLATEIAKISMKEQNADKKDAKMSVYVNGKEIKKIDEITNAIKKIDVISTDDKKLWAIIKSDFKKYIKKHKAQKIIANKTKESDVKVYTVNGDKDKIKVLLMNVEPTNDENTVLQVLGDDMEIKEIIKMAKATNISGAPFLIKLGEKHILDIDTKKQHPKKILNLKPYDEIVVSGAFEVKLVKGKEGKVTVDAPEKKLSLIEVTSDGKKLNIRFKKSRLTLSGKEKMVVTVPYQTLLKITVSGASKIKGNDGFSQSKLKLNASGASSINLNKINTKNLQIDASGAAKLQLQGKASVLSAKLSGASKIAFLVVAVLCGCNNGKSDALQKYCLEKESDPNFMVVSIPSSLISLTTDTPKELANDVLPRLKKLKVFIFKPSSKMSEEAIAKEQKTATTILKQIDYEELMKVKGKSDKEMNKIYEEAFDWIAEKGAIKPLKNLAEDMVKKANQIAAGEVIQRPASVVKELLENSIDAGAKEIKLYVKKGGKTLLQVIDNGCGMNATDAVICFERHATSKIQKADDLFKIATKGFRGEAMAATAAISQVHLITKQTDDEIGREVLIEGGAIQKNEEIVAKKGTSIAVKRLFFNIPARRQFLKTDSVEFRHIINEFYRVAIPHENIAFELHHNDQLRIQLPIQNKRQRIGSIFGQGKDEHLVPVNEQTEIIKVAGFVGKPEFAKKKRGEQFLFVNDRFVKSPYLNHAINKAFEGMIGEGKHPTYFLFIKIDPADIDINIHPSKTEIKFEDEKIVYNLIKASVKHALGQFQLDRTIDFDSNPDFKIDENEVPIINPKIAFDPSYTPFQKDRNTSEQRKENNKKAWENLYTTPKNEVKEPDAQMLFNPKKEAISEEKSIQIAHKYILCKLKSGFVLIHQNRAHKRILYDRFQKTAQNAVMESQQLLFPLKIQVDLATIEGFRAIKNELKSVGFSLKFKDNHIIVNGIPTPLKESDVESVLNLFFEGEKNEENRVIRDWIHLTLANTAAIKSGRKITNEERQNLIDELFACENHRQCPNGKKIIETFDENTLERIFQKT
uniref:DNA mismatch repair protein MutL n=1 Tax=Stylophora pistillata TaxID=50429 RepID=A0A2B4R8R8_STYPI